MTVIAIDGPGGSGKSTLARALAERLGIEHLDTGAMYRAVALAALQRHIGIDDAERLTELAKSLELSIGDTVLLDGVEVTEAIRSDPVNAVVSQVATHRGVRAELVRRQRAWVAEHGSAVVEGRDIGTVVLPHADLKVFLTASPAERARRRAAERGRVEQVAAEQASIEARDRIDAGRVESPLVVARDAVLVDNTDMSLDELVSHVLQLLESKDK